MVNKKMAQQATKGSLVAILAMFLAIASLGFGGISYLNPQEGTTGTPGEDGIDGIDGIDGLNGTDGIDGIDGLNGTDGTDGTNGLDGEDLTGSIVVGILNPSNEQILKGDVTVKALIFGSESFSIEILIKGTVNGTNLPYTLDTSDWEDGNWNLTIKITDTETIKTIQEGRKAISTGVKGISVSNVFKKLN